TRRSISARSGGFVCFGLSAAGACLFSFSACSALSEPADASSSARARSELIHRDGMAFSRIEVWQYFQHHAKSIRDTSPLCKRSGAQKKPAAARHDRWRFLPGYSRVGLTIAREFFVAV